MDQFQVKTDQDGNIVLRNLDGGDCSAETGRYFTLMAVRRRFGIDNSLWPLNLEADYWASRYRLFTNKKYLYRYPHKPYDDLFDVSRDQTMPMIIAAAFHKDRELVENIWHEVVRNLYRFPNGDPCGPADIATFIRAYRECGIDSSPVGGAFDCFLGDSQLLGGSFIRALISRSEPDNVGDCLNHTCHLILSHFQSSTRTSRLALGTFANWRKPYVYLGGDSKEFANYMTTGRYLKGQGVQYAWDHYYRPETQNNPFHDLARPVIRRIFGSV